MASGELTDQRLELVLTGVGGQLDLARGDPDRLAVTVLHPDVDGAGRVVTHQHGGQAGGDAVVALEGGDL